MPSKPGLREQKKAATRRHISDVATRMFSQRGFDQVTVEDIARAAMVTKMTVFNHFPRKEDLVVDREAEFVLLVHNALSAGAPLPSLRELFLRMAREGHPLMGGVEGGPAFFALLSSSPVLLARAWAVGDAVEAELVRGFRRHRWGRLEATLAASMITALWRTVWRDGPARVKAWDSIAMVRAHQRRLLQRGFDAVDAAFPGRV